MKLFDEINFGDNVIKKYICAEIDKNTPLSSQIYELSEDILQVEYSNSCILDVGWYPEFDLKGHFSVLIVKDNNWENPISIIECDDCEGLISAINESIKIIKLVKEK
jgi:hypothetical protein